MKQDDRTARQISRSQTKKAGDRSAKLARVLMEMKPATLAKLMIDDELREAIERARQVESPQARRRAERTLAGDLRGVDLVELTSVIENVGTANDPGIQFFHTVERWRDRLIAEGTAALRPRLQHGDFVPWHIYQAGPRAYVLVDGERRSLERSVELVASLPDIDACADAEPIVDPHFDAEHAVLPGSG